MESLQQIDTRKELIDSCIAGDRRAQKKLYDDYANAMFNLAFRMTGNRADAEDVLQNSFVQVFRHLNRFKFECTPGSWIKRIVINNSIDCIKKRKLVFSSLDDKLEEPADQQDSITTYDIRAVREAISSLPDGYRIVLSLYLIEGYDHSEISQILNISVATSKSQYSRARTKLKGLISMKMMYNES